jgi:hypothetical protein
VVRLQEDRIASSDPSYAPLSGLPQGSPQSGVAALLWREAPAILDSRLESVAPYRPDKVALQGTESSRRGCASASREPVQPRQSCPSSRQSCPGVQASPWSHEEAGRRQGVMPKLR